MILPNRGCGIRCVVVGGGSESFRDDFVEFDCLLLLSSLSIYSISDDNELDVVFVEIREDDDDGFVVGVVLPLLVGSGRGLLRYACGVVADADDSPLIVDGFLVDLLFEIDCGCC